MKRHSTPKFKNDQLERVTIEIDKRMMGAAMRRAAQDRSGEGVSFESLVRSLVWEFLDRDPSFVQSGESAGEGDARPLTTIDLPNIDRA